MLALGLAAALLASVLFNVGIALQGIEARSAPSDLGHRVSLLVLLLRRPRWLIGWLLGIVGVGPQVLALAVALALVLNPLVNELRPIVERLFPIPSTIKAALGQLMGQAPGLGTALLVFALIPAVCEEFAFRGFILSGLERQHRTRSAILLSALMFGFLHVLLSLFQQLFNATLLGIVLGLLAVRSRSIWPGILFHFLNNSLAVSQGYFAGHSAAGPSSP